MTKREQIEEMEEVIYNSVYKYFNLKNGGYCPTLLIAEALYDAGYRKAFTSELATDTQKAYKDGIKENDFKDLEKEMNNAFLELQNLQRQTEIKEIKQKIIELEKQRAVKDFAERLKEKAKPYSYNVKNIDTLTICNSLVVSDIDELLKEFL